jgi:uncharacterized protein (DUF1684 family)
MSHTENANPISGASFGSQSSSRWWSRVLLLAGIVTALACGSQPPSSKSYATKIAEARTEKDAMLASSNDPIPRQQHAIFLPLAYFPVDPDYDAPASLKPSNDPTIVPIPTSVGSADEYRRVGTLEFVLKGQSLKLTTFVPASAKAVDRLFVPFRDLTARHRNVGSRSLS